MKSVAPVCLAIALLAQACALGGEADEIDSTAGESHNDGGGGSSFTRPLRIPPVLAPTRTDATTDYYDLEMRAGSVQIRPSGSLTPIWGYNGLYPGPTIVATRGRQVQVTQRNSLSENTTVHNHGHKVAASSDGHPTDYIAPGASKTYFYPNDQRAGTYWYHDHTMDLTGDHVYRGLAAFYIIRDPAEDALNLPSGAYDVPLLIQDKTFNTDNTLYYDPDPNRDGFVGDIPVVNGVEKPYFNVANRKYRFRVLNGANARRFTLAFRKSGTSTNLSFQVIGSDGGLLAAPVTVTTLEVAPAERYDIVVNFNRGDPLNTTYLLADGGDRDWSGSGELLQFRFNRTESDPSTVPATLSTITRYQRSQAVGTYDIQFDEDNGVWELNGVPFDPARIDVTNRLGRVYIWRLINNSRRMHPFHKHLTEFQVLSQGGSRWGGPGPGPTAVEAGWKDTVAVEDGEMVEIIFTNETFTGTYVFHCHRLEHEDHRMMLQEQTQP